MARTPSTMIPLGTPAPSFSLRDTNGKMISLDQFKDNKPLLVMFICNHCPFVQLIRPQLASLGHDYEYTVNIVAIMSNDAVNYPEDAPPKMADEVREHGYVFPYLYDETQEVARACRAACTPDFFLFDRAHSLVYRGQLDDARPGNGRPVTGRDLRAAIDATLASAPVSADQKPSVGCNIKWKQTNV